MPRISDFILDSVIYLYGSPLDAEKGERAGGSGFLVGVESEAFPEEFVSVYAITNKHIVDNGASVIRINTKDGKSKTLDMDDADWVRHPDGDDLAACFINFKSEDPYIWEWFIPSWLFVTDESIKEHNIGPGDDTFLVGRFVDHQGNQKNLPSARFGNIAMMPGEPIKLASGYLQEAFLVESRSVGGYSGSPVFVHILPMSKRWEIEPSKKKPTGTGFRMEDGTFLDMLPKGPWLLGVDCGHMPFQGERSDRVIDEYGKEHPDGWRIRGNAGMVTVIPSWRLMGLLNTEEFVKNREKEDRKLNEKMSKEPQAS